MGTVKTQNHGASSQAIQHHYDIGNDFYRLWLDPTLNYSCALWEENEGYDAHEIAQVRKLDFHITQARVKGTKRVLDIGCGWGSLLRRLVEVHGVETGVGITLSKTQADFISRFNHPKIQVYLESWSEHIPREPYDGIISIGAFEHFAKSEVSNEEKIEAYRAFFSRCHSWLKPGGWMSIQTIVYENSTKEDLSQFFAEEIFPESDLPRLSDIAKASDRLFEIVALRNDREHYVRTLKAWLKNMKANRTAAVDMVGEEVVARYEKYLSFSMIGFHSGATNLSRIVMHRLDNLRQ